jgi:hypothetical protein
VKTQTIALKHPLPSRTDVDGDVSLAALRRQKTSDLLDFFPAAMDLWERARAFAGEAANWSQELSAEATKRSSALVSETAKKSKEIFSETASKSLEIAAEATKQADLLAGQIKHLASDIPVPSIPPIPAIPPIAATASSEPDAAELERYGITDDLREFVKDMTISTFRDFPLQGAVYSWLGLGDSRLAILL